MISTASQTTDEIQMMTLQDVAKVLRYTTRHVISLINSNRIPKPTRVGGGNPRWPRHQIIEWISAGCPEVGPADEADCKKE